MKVKTLILFSIIALLLFNSCGKEGGCFKKPGNESSITMPLIPFTSIVANDVFDITLHQDSVNYATITGGENMLENISVVVIDNTLYLENNNKCIWVKPRHNKIKITIGFESLSSLTANKSCDIKSDNAITGNEFGIILKEKVQNVDLILNLNTFYYWNNDPCGGELKLHGQCEMLKIWNYALMSVYAKDLITKNAQIESHSTGDIYVNVNENLNCAIYHVGNVFYYGNPAYIQLIDEGEGDLINANPQ